MRRALAVTFLAAVVTRSAGGQTVTARVGGELTGFPGSYLTVPVVVDMSQSGGAKLGSYTARLSWNTAVLNLDCYSSYCDTLAGNFPAPQVNSDSGPQGVLRFGAIAPAGAEGLITLVRFRFYIADTTSSALDLAFSEMSAAGTFADLGPSLSATSGTFCAARGHWGDLDGDVRSNSRDALVILSQVVGLAVNPDTFDLSLADVDGDDQANSRDALIILSYAVGLDVPGQRVLLLAPRSCATGSPRQVSVFPAAVTLTTTQPFRLLAQAVDSVGRAVTVPDAIWQTSDPSVLDVDASGSITPRLAGTATVTALVSPGLRASAAVTVIPRRPNWYVDGRVTGAPVQVGTAAAPLEHPARVFPLVSEGDTIRVAPGTYDFTDDGELPVGAVIIGGTPGDTTTRPVFRDPSNAYTALWLGGGIRTVIRNITFRDFYYTVDLDGVRNFAIEDSRVYYSAGVYGDGVYVSGYGAIDTLRVDRTVFLGDSTQGYSSYSGTAISTDWDPQRVGLALVRDSRIQFFDDGIFLTDVDSAVIQRSVISDNSENGIETDQEYDVLTSLHVTQSRIERNYYEGIYADYVRRVIVDSSVIRATYDDAIYVYGDCCSPSVQVYLRGDSIYFEADDYDWFDLSYGDTLVIDQTIVRMPADTAIYMYSDIDADKVFVTNSKFLNIGYYGEGFYGSASEALFDNVDFTGCNVVNCDTGYGLELSSGQNTLSARVQNSRFANLYYAAYLDGGVHVVTGNTVDSAQYGLYLQGDSVVATGNVLTRAVRSAIEVSDRANRGASVVSGNSVTCTPYTGSQPGLRLSGGLVIVQNDTATGCREGIFVATLTSGSVIQSNVIRNAVWGIYVQQYDTTRVPLLRNAVSGSDSTAVFIEAGRVLLRGNNIRNNDRDGLGIPFSTGYVSIADSNAFVNNARYAINAASDSVDARDNWWGLATGPGSGAGADSVTGRVATSPYLTSGPATLPGLAPLAGAPRLAMPLATAVAVEQPAPMQGANREVRKVRATRGLPAGLSARAGPQAGRRREHQTAKDAREAERRQARDARRAAHHQQR